MAETGLTLILPFSTAGATDVTQAGGKGAMLARLFQAGFPVPAGGIVSTQALPTLFQTQNLSAASSPAEAQRLLLTLPPPQILQDELHVLLTRYSPTPATWAVRSSAVAEDNALASFAGVYESYLEVPASDLWPMIQACWASWWSERALAYRQRLGDTSALPRMAVVLQPMVAARCAGVAFTAEPLSGDATRLVLNAAPGLGVAVVSGVVQPEQYVLAKHADLRILDTRLLDPDRPLLTPDVVRALGMLCERLETFCGCPQDIEWAWDGTRCWILQSRPITTMTGASEPGTEIVWSNANLKDVIPGLVSPFSWSLMRQQLDTALRQQYAQMGYAVPPDVPIVRRHWGRAYFNISLFQYAAYTLYGSTPAQQVAQLGGAMVPGFTPPAEPPTRWQRLRWLGNMLRFGGVADRVRKAAPASFAQVARYWRNTIQQASQLDRPVLLSTLDTFASLSGPFLLQHLVLTSAMSGNFSYLAWLVQRWLPQAAPGFVAELVTGLGEVSSAEHSYGLWELACLARQEPPVMAFLQQRCWQGWQNSLTDTPFGRAWQDFLETYGHRSLYEVEMANPRWREQPDYLFDMIAAYARLSQDVAPFDPQFQTRRRQQAEQYAMQQLAGWRRYWFRTILRRTQAYSRLRENSKSHLVQWIDIGRCMALAAGRFLVQDGLLPDPEAVFLLEADEIKAALHGTLPAPDIAQRLQQRRLERQRYAALQAPEVFLGERPLYERPLAARGLILQGLPSSPGRVTGTARVLRSPEDRSRLQVGEILVAPSTDPGWTPLFLLAAGLVMETGGYLSHGAIVAREYGIPAVLNIAMATRRIPDGSLITLDGGQGTVLVEDDSAVAPDLQ